MKVIVCLGLILASVVAATAGLEKEAVIAQEKAIWDSAQRKDLEKFQQLVAPQVRGVFADGMMVMQDYLTALPKRTMTAVELRDFDVVFPDSETATVVYTARVGTMKDNREEIGTVNAGTVWRKTDGRWQAIFHAEAKQEPAK